MTAAIAGGAVVGVAVGNPLTSGAEGGAASAASTTTAPPSTDQAPPAGEPGKDGRPDGRGRGPGGGFDLDAAAKALGLTTDELKAQLQDGKSLAAIAEAQGVDKQTLIDALVKAAEARLDELKAELPDRIADLVDRTPPAGGDHGFGGGPGGRGGPGGHGAGLDAAAKALGISAEDLRTALQDGSTIAEVAKDKGVDVQKVIDAMVAEAKAHLDEEVKAGDLTQDEADQRLADLTTRIGDLVQKGFPAGGPGGPGMPGGGPGMPGGDGN